MTTSENVDKIFPAFILAQSETAAAKKSSENPFFKSKYADLAEIIETAKPALIKNGLGIIQSPSGNGQAISVTCRIIHSSGQWIEDTITLTAVKSDPQAMGSAITYGRRYQLAALLNIAQEDDDGNNASGSAKGQKPEGPTLRQINLEEISKIIKLGKLSDEQIKKVRQMAGKSDATDALQEAQIMMEEWKNANS